MYLIGSFRVQQANNRFMQTKLSYADVKRAAQDPLDTHIKTK